MTTQEATAETAPPKGPGFAIRLESLIVLAVLGIGMSFLSPHFLQVSNLMNILLATAVFGILAFGATFVIASGGIDLSLGSVLALSGVAGALSMNALNLPWPIGIAICLLTGCLCGAVNGLLNTKGGIPAFIVTLGMLGVARGLALTLTNGVPVYGLPDAVIFLGQGRLFKAEGFVGIPVPVVIFLIVAALAHFTLSQTRFGKYALVIGDNEMAARAMGIRVERHRVKLYVLSGAMAGLAGLVFIARVNSGDPTAGLNYELTAITAAILGGSNLFGGRASVAGTLIGALVMGVLQNGLNLLAVPSFYQQMAIGAVLVAAVWLDQMNRKRAAK